MHSLAYAKAIQIGPRVVYINGVKRAAYSLNFEELKKIFTKEGYNINRITWRKTISTWGDPELWNELTPADNVLLNKNTVGWFMVFRTLSPSDLQTLRKFAEDHEIKALPWDLEQIGGGLEICPSSA